MSDHEHAFSHKDDFRVVYDLDSPRAYFQALAPLDYRMPAVTCGVLRHLAPRLAAAFGRTPLRVLDFACGFGVNGALLKHRVTLSEIYRHFAQGPADPAAAQAFFAARRAAVPDVEVGGIDIAEQALAYGREAGFLDAAFAVDLARDAVAPALSDFLAGTHVVIETGSLFDVLVAAVDRLLGTGARPWILVAPRPDVEVAALYRVLARHGYRHQACNRRPIRYRKLLGAREADEAARAIKARGEDPAGAIEDGYFLVDLVLARPSEDATDLGEIPESLFHD